MVKLIVEGSKKKVERRYTLVCRWCGCIWQAYAHEGHLWHDRMNDDGGIRFECPTENCDTSVNKNHEDYDMY